MALNRLLQPPPLNPARTNPNRSVSLAVPRWHHYRAVSGKRLRGAARGILRSLKDADWEAVGRHFNALLVRRNVCKWNNSRVIIEKDLSC